MFEVIKFPLNMVSEQKCSMPSIDRCDLNERIVYCGVECGQLYLWMSVDTQKETREYTIRIFPAGTDISNFLNAHYAGAFMYVDLSVWVMFVCED